MFDPEMMKKKRMRTPMSGGQPPQTQGTTTPYGEIAFIFGGESSEGAPRPPQQPGTGGGLKSTPGIPSWEPQNPGGYVRQTPQIPMWMPPNAGGYVRQSPGVPSWESPWGGGRYDRGAGQPSVGDMIWEMMGQGV